MTPSRALLAAACLAALCARAHDVAPPAPPAPPPAPGEPTPAAAPRAQAEAWRRWGDDYRHEMQGAMGTLFAARVGSGTIVKGAPYSAEVVTETRQTLADGNVIEHMTHGAVYRDGMGRVRQETERGTGGKHTVYIDDPVAKAGIMVLPGGKRAIAIPSSSQLGPGRHSAQAWALDGRELRIEDGKTYVDGKVVDPASVRLKSASGSEVRVGNGRILVDGKPIATGGTPVIVVADESGGTTHEEVLVRTVRTDGDTASPLPPIPPIPPLPPLPPFAPGEIEAPIAPLPPMPGVSTLRFESTERLGRGVTTSLGSKEVEGVRADGRSTVWTIAAGQVGNQKPIEISSESWYAPDLQVTVYSRYHDPRTGDSIYRLAKIRRGEPSPDLFKAPAS